MYHFIVNELLKHINEMEKEEVKRLIELAISAHQECYACEGTCFLSPEEEWELNELIKKYRLVVIS